MNLPLSSDTGEFVLRLLMAGAYALILFLLKEAWREMHDFKKEFGALKENHSERLTVIETTMQLPRRRRVAERRVANPGEVDDA